MAAQPSIRIFRPGTFTDIHGQTVTFGRPELEQIVATYDAAADPAPMVIGHPQHDNPAYGWIGKLELDGDVIVARPDDIEPAFGEAVRAGRFRKVSASFYPPRHPANPKPDGWYLKHVGFLGAAAPAVKGLGTVAFSEADEAAAFTLPFKETEMDTPTTGDREVAFAERETALDTREADIARREEEQAVRDQQTADTARQVQHDNNVSFAEGLIAAATLAPAKKELVVGILDQLDAAATVSFGEGDANQLTPNAAFRSLFEGAQPVVALGEHAPADTPQPGMVTVSFAAPQGYSVDPTQAALHAKAREIQAANPGMTFWDAFTQARSAG